MKKLLLVGWDAADWRIIGPLMEQGKMPNLQGLMHDGVWGNLATLQPALSPILWTSIATGKRADKHGIHGFSEPDLSTGGVRPITNLSRKTKAIWNILSQSDKKCNVVGWWPSSPVEAINGVMVSNHFQTAPKLSEEPWPLSPGTIYPPRLQQSLAELRLRPMDLDGDMLLPFIPDAAEIDQTKENRLLSLAKVTAENASIHAVATQLLQTEPWNFMAVYFDGIDHYGHGFMKYHPPRQEHISEEDFNRYKSVMATAYAFHDMMLGVLLTLAGKDTTVLIMSDHGFHPDHLRPRYLPNEPAGPAAEHRNYGIFVMQGPGIKKGKTEIHGATLLDIAPTVLHAFGLPVGRDMDGKVLESVFSESSPIQRIDSWDTVQGNSGMHPTGAQLDPQDAQAAMDQLIELGYIDKLDADQAIAVDKTTCELQYNLAQSHVDANQYGKAIAIFKKLWEQWPEESRFGIRLMHCYLSLRKPRNARKTLNLIVERKQQYASKAQLELQKIHQDKIAEKTSTFSTLPNSELDDPASNNVAPERITDEDLTPKELEQVRQLQLKAQTNSEALNFFEGLVLQSEQHFEQALDCFSRLLTVEPNRRVSVLTRMGDACLSLKRWDQAEAHFSAIITLDPENALARMGLCQSFLPRKRNLEAAAQAQASIKLKHLNPHGHYLYGIALHRCGHIEWAVDALQEAVRQNPLFPKAYKRLAFIYSKRLKNETKAAEYKLQAEQAQLLLKKQCQSATSSMDQPPQDHPSMSYSPFMLNHTGKVRCPQKQWITVVAGLPRSGTSMLMQILQAGGLPLLTDAQREADASNQRGYFEHEAIKSLDQSTTIFDDALGKVVKVVIPQVQHLPQKYSYKIIFLERDLDEILASQESMLKRNAKVTRSEKNDVLKKVFIRQIQGCKKLLLHYPQADCLSISHNDTIHAPEKTIDLIMEFLKIPDLNRSAMIAAVSSELYRIRLQPSHI